VIVRMVRIEARRNVVVLLLPILAAIAWLQARNGLQTPVVVWPQVTVQARDWIVYLGPFVAAAAAWMGARERRHGMEDLLATTPCPVWQRRAATWTATTLWGLLAYGAVAVGILAYGATRATWGAPLAWPFCWPLLIGLLALPAHAAVGFALGRYAPSRYTPLVAIALLLVQAYVGGAIGEGARPGLGPLLGRLLVAGGLRRPIGVVRGDTELVRAAGALPAGPDRTRAE